MGDFQDRSQFERRERYGYYQRPRTDYTGAFTNAVQQHPMAAALIGMGVLWLFMGGNKVSIGGGDGRVSLFSLAGEGASRAGGAVKSAAGTVSDTVASGMSSAAHAVSDTVGAMAGAVSSAAGAVSGTVADAAHGVRHSMEGKASGSEYRNDMDEFYGEDQSSGRSYKGSSMGSSMSTMRRNIADVFDRYPLALAAAGLALGAGAAASLPMTEAEKSVMGKAGEAAMAKAREMGEEAVEVASAAMDEAGTRMGGNPAASSTSF